VNTWYLEEGKIVRLMIRNTLKNIESQIEKAGILFKCHINQLKHCIMKKTWILFTAIALLVVGLILNFTVCNQFSAGDFVFNYFAAGDFACGVFAAGRFSCGIFSIGIFSIGIFSIGIFNIGLYTIGLFLIGWKKNYGCWLEKKPESFKA